MLLTPLLLVAADRWWIPLLAGGRATVAGLEMKRAAAPAGDHRRLRPLRADRRPHAVTPTASTPTVLDHDAEAIEALRKFGWRVFYGDATRLDLMRTAGAAEARVLVVAIDDVEQSVDGREDGARATSRTLTIVARARNVQHYYELYELGVTLIERETLDSALMSARSALEQLGWQPHQARNLALRFRRHNVAQLRRSRRTARTRRGSSPPPSRAASSSRSCSRSSASRPPSGRRAPAGADRRSA